MPTIEINTRIAAPLERVFDLARCIDLHTRSTAQTSERAIAGVTTGLIGPGEEVTWAARHFGVWQSLSVLITEYDRPNHFQDTMQRGIFRSMQHDHFFSSEGSITAMRDVFSFRSPLGFLGCMADVLFLTRYMGKFLATRNAVIKRVAESDEWPIYLPGETH